MRLLAALVLMLAACGSTPPAATSEPGTGATAEPDPRRVCAVDGQCQLVPSCDCQRCVPSKQMDVEPCPNICVTSPCTGVVPRCDDGQCVAAPIGNH